MGLRASTSGAEVVTRPGFEQVLFVEMGWGADQHGQNATKACVRAARNDAGTGSLYLAGDVLKHLNADSVLNL